MNDVTKKYPVSSILLFSLYDTKLAFMNTMKYTMINAIYISHNVAKECLCISFPCLDTFNALTRYFIIKNLVLRDNVMWHGYAIEYAILLGSYISAEFYLSNLQDLRHVLHHMQYTLGCLNFQNTFWDCNWVFLGHVLRKYQLWLKLKISAVRKSPFLFNLYYFSVHGD